MCDGVSMCQLRSTDAVAGRRVGRRLLALPLLAAFGLADSSYLLWRHGREAGGFCLANGCDVVNRSDYAEIAGIPVAAFGVAAYLLLLALSVAAAAGGHRGALGMIIAVAGIGMGISAWLVYLQVAVIGAICAWCMLSALTMTSIFVVSLSARS